MEWQNDVGLESANYFTREGFDKMMLLSDWGSSAHATTSWYKGISISLRGLVQMRPHFMLIVTAILAIYCYFIIPLVKSYERMSLEEGECAPEMWMSEIFWTDPEPEMNLYFHKRIVISWVVQTKNSMSKLQHVTPTSKGSLCKLWP